MQITENRLNALQNSFTNSFANSFTKQLAEKYLYNFSKFIISLKKRIALSEISLKSKYSHNIFLVQTAWSTDSGGDVKLMG